MKYFLVSVFGLVIGSFLNVCIHRLPRGESLVRPSSRCPKCGEPIRPYDNIPVLSFLLLRGKCRKCGGAISPRYPVVELLSPLAGIALLFGGFSGPGFFIYWFFSLVLIAIAFIDMEHGVIPDVLTIPVTALGLAVNFSVGAFFGAFVGALSVALMGAAGKLLFRKEAVGGGDIKLMAMLGAFLGWEKVLLAFFIAPFFGSVAGLYVMIRKKGETIAYAPHLALGAFLSLLFGDRILSTLFGR